MLRFLLAGLLVVGACASVGHPPPAPPRHTGLGISISSFALPNGLRVVLVTDPNATEVQVTMRYAVGAADDPPEHPGMAHLVEHLMFQQVLGAESLFAHLEDIATFFNAFTTKDATTYVSRGAPDQLDTLFSIEAVRMGFRCASISDSAFTRERAVVANELTARDEASELLGALYRAILSPDHPYGRVDNSATVGAITREQACAFADAHYAPSRAALVVSGNLSQGAVVASLGKFLARVAKRDAAPIAAVDPLPAQARQLEASVAIDHDALLFLWPSPANPDLRWKVAAIAPYLQSVVDREVEGRVTFVTLGDVRVPMLGVLVELGETETLAHALEGAKRGIAKLPRAFEATDYTWLDELSADIVQQSTIYSLYSTLEDGILRDARLASYVLEGRDPARALALEFEGVRSLKSADSSVIASGHLALAQATIVTLKASGAKKRGHDISLAPPVHDIGQRRSVLDPTQAHQFATGRIGTAALGRMRTRTLPNGLRIVLLPLTSTPTVDLRLVFNAGMADDPVARRGTAEVAGYELSWDPRYFNDELLMVRSGGSEAVDVGRDQTTFTTRGVDMHLDMLLAGLRRRVREGIYDFDTKVLARYVRAARKHADDETAFEDAWRTALYGAQHPYVRAGLARYANEALSVNDAAAFRAAHYTPDNATLIIAGRFDPDLADQWIDYLFADWTGHASDREAPRPQPTEASLAKDDDLSQVHVKIALPTRMPRAQVLVATEMLDAIAWDVRHQLGASYTFRGSLAESRLATEYIIDGWIDAKRCTEAMQLIRDRIDKLRTDPDEAARAFVSARNRVLTRLVSLVGSASALAAQAENDIAAGRQPMADLSAASSVQVLTIDGMTDALAELDLSRAAILMRGPDADTKAAFALLGRTPTQVHVDKAALDALPDEPTDTSSSGQGGREVDYYAPPITQDPNALDSAVGLQGFVSWAYASVHEPAYPDIKIDSASSGPAFGVGVGKHVHPMVFVGGRVSLGLLSGQYTTGPGARVEELGHLTVDGDIVAQLQLDRVWFGALFGFHADSLTRKISGIDVTDERYGLSAGLELGVDIIHHGAHHLGLFGRMGAARVDTGWLGLALGVAYRR